ncbi:MAG: EVE domain-containing protein [Cyanobacteria bacterium P01_A01_bin.45]
MAYWLLKTEPEEYSYNDLEKEKTTVWNGVNNALALKHMRTMQPGDLAFIYHTGKQKKIVGIGLISSQPYPDPELNEAKRTVVKVQAVEKVTVPVSLKEIKQDDSFKDFEMLRLPRLSVVPVAKPYWQRLIALCKSEISAHSIDK